ncbi:RNA polymerase II transcriptional coactivator KIWI -like protein [Gossypium arboreum]|uniref:RNA polymerase II transcriptional coactivator KIWI-like protein n=1 Tax=Gossypium arboreum TaxID=29729 RepID=A0A0B0N234_GOSAR|nr:RNA polymerase II transcriptional coactivator KIWI-like isoform X1 [Gossypium arboreum]KHG06662.1 RNA polymerase II transcriptional coactivator KIWI -like protein [Gossypium arboreum]
MSFRGKRKDGEGLASDENEDHAPPNKVSKTFSAVDSDDSDDVVVCEISKNRRVSVRNWNGKIWVDIREFYVKDGKQLPGKKGISLSLDQWNVLRDHAEAIDKALAENS